MIFWRDFELKHLLLYASRVACLGSCWLNERVDCGDAERRKPNSSQDGQGHPRPHLASVLALLWTFPSLGAVLILLLDQPGAEPRQGEVGWWMWIQSIRLEHWVAVAILLTHGYFVKKLKWGNAPSGVVNPVGRVSSRALTLSWNRCMGKKSGFDRVSPHPADDANVNPGGASVPTSPDIALESLQGRKSGLDGVSPHHGCTQFQSSGHGGYPLKTAENLQLFAFRLNSIPFHRTLTGMLDNSRASPTEGRNRCHRGLLATLFIMLGLGVILENPGSSMAATQGKGFERTPLFGRNYVEALEWAHANSATCKWIRSKEELLMTSEKFKLLLVVDSQKAYLNGVQVWLSAPVAMYQSGAYIAESDLQTLIHPILFPSRRDHPAKTIVLDPGHGGKDRGKPAGIQEEKTHTLALARTLKPLLEAKGYTVAMTRSEDTTIVLEDRSEIAHQKGGHLFVSLHFNSAGEGGSDVSGIEVYCMTPAGESSTHGTNDPAERNFAPGNRFDSQNAALGYQVQRAVANRLGTEDRGLRRARFAVLKMAHMPSILVEGGFMSNPREARSIASLGYRRKLAEAIADGIDTYVSLTNPVDRKHSKPSSGKASKGSGSKGLLKQ